ncbi:MAG: TonB-dependent receptor [Bacteroidales bacterium]|nr:TonB-dependent receptor [Bacteroidales bacterium]
MKKLVKIVIVLLTVILFNANAENEKQISQLHGIVRGKISDKNTGSVLPGANIILANTEKTGTCSDKEGNYIIKVPVGRQSFIISYIGYSPVFINNIEIGSGKEIFLDIKLEEKPDKINEVYIKPDKLNTVNEMALISSRSFTIEETNKYAGSWGDPARMVSGFAGVISAGDQRNDIIIRGNSPLNLLWKLEGVSIPNPNHFGTLGTTGGAISILNNNTLSNSDFYTGLFPASFGNALSGVFDLNMRNGNPYKREHTIQMGFNGFEIGTEGPINISKQSSYIFNYRYTMAGLMVKMGIMNIGGIPSYQDMTFKINMPTLKFGKFSVFGIGGLSHIYLDEQTGEKDNSFTSEVIDSTVVQYSTNMGVVGLSHTYFINNNTYLKNIISVNGKQSNTQVDLLNNNEYEDYYNDDYIELSGQYLVCLKSKINIKNIIETGLIHHNYAIKYFDEFQFSKGNYMITLTDVKKKIHLNEAFVQWQNKRIKDVTISLGIHSQKISLNKEITCEPRAAIKWKINEKHSLGAGYGLHAQTVPKINYFTKTLIDTLNSLYIETNNELKFLKSHHFGLEYHYYISGLFHAKLEPYYQYLFDIPVEKEGSSFSLINYGSQFHTEKVDSLISKGSGENYGIELTLEKFFNMKYYFLITTSLFNSTYKGSNNIKYNSAFNQNFVLNMLFGYEIEIKSNNLLNFNIRNVYSGGNRYTPINLEASKKKGKTVLNENFIHEYRYKNYFRCDVRLSFTLNKPGNSHQWAVEIKNLTDRKNIFYQYYNASDGTIKNTYQIGFYPMMSYKFNF